MSGLGGGEVATTSLRTLTSGLEGRTAETTWEYEDDEFGLSVRHPSFDPGGMTVWNDGRRAGAVYGAITNLHELGLEEQGLFDRLLANPVDTAERLEGGFLIACYDGRADRQLVVTDKLGSRSCFYTESGPFLFATAVGALVPLLSGPTYDRQGISNMLLMGKMWGERTLVDGITTLRAATVLDVTNGTRSTTRYWRPDYEPHARESSYFDELADRYRQAAGRVARTLPSTVGLWLSGGLDSRTTAAALVENAPGNGIDIRAYGYDANPPTNDNPQVASAVASELGIEYVQIPLNVETFGADFERVIDVTDGMLQWNTTANLSPSYHVDGDAPVLMEGVQGELIGDHLLRYHLDDSKTVVESQFASEATTSTDRVDELLTVDVDPLEPFKREAKRTPETSFRGKVLDIHFQNYYARAGLESNRLMRDRGGSRAMQVDGDYLEWCARVPTHYRKGSFPLSERIFTSDAGGVPYGTAIAKLELCQRICPELSDIIYERTKVEPSRPYHLHVAGFVGNVLVNRLRSKPTYANGQLQDFWIRDAESAFHHRVSELVDDACDRTLFDADAVTDIYASHLDGANNASLIARITTLEYWLQNHLD